MLPSLPSLSLSSSLSGVRHMWGVAPAKSCLESAQHAVLSSMVLALEGGEGGREGREGGRQHTVMAIGVWQAFE